MVKLFSVGNWFGVQDVFIPLFGKNIFVIQSAEELHQHGCTKDDVILFGGGADIFPGFYKQKASQYNGTINKAARDIIEESIFEEGSKIGAKMLGICRGAQLLCALSGGDLVQHVTNHAGNGHQMETIDGDTYFVSSAHHQMMNPFKTEHELIAWSKEQRSTCYLVEKEKNINMEVEPEVVYFPQTSSLAIQYHPEFMADNAPAVGYARELVKTYLLGGSNAV